MESEIIFKVLILDDEVDITDIITGLLTKHGILSET